MYDEGKATRDYVRVSDVSAAFAAAADTDQPGVGEHRDGVETSVLDLIRELSAVTGQHLETRFEPARTGELARSTLDPSAAARDFGWTARTPIGEGLASVWRWVQVGSPDR